MTKSYEEINEKIRKGKAVVLTAEEVSEMAKTMAPKEILEKVDVVTTATFGAMCSSGAFLNFGHANPPIRMERIEINGVPVSGGLAAVDTFVGATDCNPQNPTYGGAHIIQELIEGRELTLEAGGKDYIALLPLEGVEAEEGDVFLYRFHVDENGDPELENIESDEEYEIVSDAFDEWLDTQEYDELVDEDYLEEE